MLILNCPSLQSDSLSGFFFPDIQTNTKIRYFMISSGKFAISRKYRNTIFFRAFMGLLVHTYKFLHFFCYLTIILSKNLFFKYNILLDKPLPKATGFYIWQILYLRNWLFKEEIMILSCQSICKSFGEKVILQGQKHLSQRMDWL